MWNSNIWKKMLRAKTIADFLVIAAESLIVSWELSNPNANVSDPRLDCQRDVLEETSGPNF